MKPTDLMQVQLAAAQQWGAFWTGALASKESEKPRDRRFAAPDWQDDAYYRAHTRRLSARVQAAP